MIDEFDITKFAVGAVITIVTLRAAVRNNLYGCISMQRYWSSLRYSFLKTLFLLAADYVVSQRLQHLASPRQIARSPTVPADGSRHVRGAQALKQAQRAARRPSTLYSARRRRLSCAAGSISCGGPDGRRQPPREGGRFAAAPLLRHRGL